jgi:beta-phosphoglucomutase-like phosphatase (HAD superfamily)
MSEDKSDTDDASPIVLPEAYRKKTTVNRGFLLMFNLDWPRFDINDQVAQANHKINDLAKEKGAGFFVLFNLSSLGAGERITALHTPAEKKPDERTLDYLRRRHWRIARDLGKDSKFKAYRDAAEMMAELRSDGHRLAAVFSGSVGTVSEELKRARILDYFEDSVYGADSVDPSGGKVSIPVIFRQAMKGRPSSDVIVVSDNPQTISDVRFLGPRATIGYLDPHGEESETRQRLKELEGTKANYAVVGGASIPWICNIIRGY